MRVQIARVLFTLLVMLSANLTTKVLANQEVRSTVDDQPLSPRLATLRDRLKSGDSKALDNFWKEIKENGAPMIEEVRGNDRDVLVTIVWQATEETRNAFVFHLPGADKPMARLLDTDLWYKTFRLQKGARFVYRLATNLPDPKEWTSLARFGNAMRPDPLNRFQFAERANELNPYEVTFYSTAELPTAESQFWSVARPKVPTGQVQRDKFISKLLGNERPIWVYTPRGYAADKKPYGLLVLFDGGLYVNSARVATTLDNLIAAGLIPPLVAVMVDNPDRFRELACNSAYADFLVQEIIPWARAKYHATDRPEQTIVGGASLGGLAAACVGFKHPEVFGNVLSQSGSFSWKPDNEKDWEWLTHQFATSARLPLRFSFEAGLLENTGGGPPGRPIPPPLLVANRNLRDTLQSKGYSIHYTEFNGNHTLFNWRETLASHLIALVGIKPEPKLSVQNKPSVTRSNPRKAIATAEVKVAPDLLKQYVGRYELDPKFTHDFVLYVSVKDHSLWVRPGYLRARRVIAKSESRFSDSENPDLDLVFTRDGKGNVTGLTLNSETGVIRVNKMPAPVPSVGNTTFKLAGHTDAEAVAIYGSFNNWIQTKNYCAKEADGWVCRVDLTPGKYTYKFLVDGLGLNDPSNSATEDDGQGHTDSVIVIKPGTLNDQPSSPRLLALRDRLTSGDRTALDEFWKEISEQGAPIIEPVAGSDGDVLVTMLWRATEETRNVYVFRLGDVSKSMVRLLDTDLWYKTFRLQKGARFIYQFATNLPDPKEWQGVSRFAGAVRNDPLNPHQYVERWNEFNPYEVTFFSAVELPSAEPQSWIVGRPKVPTGRVQRDKFISKLLGNERPIWIYTPHGYSAEKKPYGLLVLTDGGLYVNTARVATTLDNLIAAGLIPPLVAVMVENPDRWRELACNSAYADFLAQEIVPWARANYHATDRPEQTIIGGTSLGGLQAACVGLKHSEVFGNVLSQSGDFKWKPDGEKEWEWVNRQFAASPRLPLRFSFEAGLMEGTWWWRDLMLQQPNPPPANLIDPTFLATNRNLRDTLQSKGYSVHYTEFNGNHGLFNWRGTLASHLIALVGIKPEPKISLSSREPVASSLVRRKAAATAEVKVAPALLKQYVGRYELDPQFTHDFVIYVSVKNDSLWVKPSSLTARRVIAESESRFYDSEIPDLHLTFIKDEKGNVTGLTLDIGTGVIRVKKMPAPVPSVGNTTFKLPGHTDAEAVAIYGSFNNWIQTKNYCAREVDGWVCRVDLAPGKYTYKFLVDGLGLNDPSNSATEDDGQGHTDSVIVIKPGTLNDQPSSPRLLALAGPANFR